ncbi:MAG TPA: hypothetical protein PLD59_02275 [Tepidisphaeraceae bacterium]|nr:hypothetical protein [Tepidisphaeraceae bacterium]
MATGNIVCSQCGKEYIWQQQLAGHDVRCTCGHVMPVPSAAPQTDSVYALAPSDEVSPAARTARVNLDDSLFQLPCPMCGRPIEFGGVVCVGCGYNVKTGEYTKKPHGPVPAHTAFDAPTPATVNRPATASPYVPPAAPARHLPDEPRQAVVLRYLAILAVLLLVATAFLAFRGNRSSAPTAVAGLTAEDAEIESKLKQTATTEAREWLARDEQRLLGRYNQRQAQAKIDEIYRAGAQKVCVLGGRFVMSVVVEVPDKVEDRKRLFEWQKQHHESIGETVTLDSGQKYIYITMPR